jgi:hypothetical protein
MDERDQAVDLLVRHHHLDPHLLRVLGQLALDPGLVRFSGVIAGALGARHRHPREVGDPAERLAQPRQTVGLNDGPDLFHAWPLL